jgi:hypothetical protein
MTATISSIFPNPHTGITGSLDAGLLFYINKIVIDGIEQKG